jgi:hypothetical protein
MLVKQRQNKEKKWTLNRPAELTMLTSVAKT